MLQYPDGISGFSPSIAFLNFGLSSFPARSLSAYIWRTTAAENGGGEEGEVGPVGERKSTDKALAGWLCQSPHPLDADRLPAERERWRTTADEVGGGGERENPQRENPYLRPNSCISCI